MKALGTSCAKSFANTQNFICAYDFYEQYPVSLKSADVRRKSHAFWLDIQLVLPSFDLAWFVRPLSRKGRVFFRAHACQNFHAFQKTQ